MGSPTAEKLALPPGIWHLPRGSKWIKTNQQYRSAVLSERMYHSCSLSANPPPPRNNRLLIRIWRIKRIRIWITISRQATGLWGRRGSLCLLLWQHGMCPVLLLLVWEHRPADSFEKDQSKLLWLLLAACCHFYVSQSFDKTQTNTMNYFQPPWNGRGFFVNTLFGEKHFAWV